MSLDKLAGLASEQEWVESEDELPAEAEAPVEQDDAGEQGEEVEAPESETEEEPDGDSEAEEEEAEEESEEEGDEESVITLDNKELKIPAGTPKEVITAVKEMERELRRGFNAKTTELAAERRELPLRLAEAETKAAEQAKTDAQKAQAQLEMLGRVALPDASLFKGPAELQALLASDRDAYEQARINNDMIRQAHDQWGQQKAALDQQIAEIDQRIAAQKEAEDQEKVKLCNEVLQDAGWDRKRLDGVLESFAENFKVTDPRFYETLRNPHLIMAMEAANKYHELQASKPGIRKKVAKSIKASSRKAPVKETGLPRDVRGRFQERRATVDDLAKII